MRILALLLLALLTGCTAARHGDTVPTAGNASSNINGPTATESVVLNGEQISAKRFRQIATSPGDDLPLPPQFAMAGPLWTNANVSIVLNCQDGKTYKENVVRTAKTIAGKFVVFTFQSQLYHQPMDIIVAYDDKASAFKVLGCYGNIVTEGTVVFNFEKKTSAASSSYGDGFTELGVGSYSDTEDSDRTLVFKNGVLFLTRETKTTPR